MHEPCKSLVYLMNSNAVGFQNSMFWELVSQVQVLEVGVVPNVKFKPAAPQGEAPGFGFPLNCRSQVAVTRVGLMTRSCLSPCHTL